MSQQWYYSLDGHTHGPVATVELTRLVGAGGLPPDALIWPVGLDPSAAIAAAAAIDMVAAANPDPATNPPPAVPHTDALPQPPAPQPQVKTHLLPKWLDDVREAENDTPVPPPKTAALPKWLADVQEAESETSQQPAPLSAPPSWVEDIRKLGEAEPDQPTVTGKTGRTAAPSWVEDIRKLGETEPDQSVVIGKAGPALSPAPIPAPPPQSHPLEPPQRLAPPPAREGPAPVATAVQQTAAVAASSPAEPDVTVSNRRAEYRKGRRRMLLGVGGVLLAAAACLAFFINWHDVVERLTPPDDLLGSSNDPEGATGSQAAGSRDRSARTGDFPRRLLAISVTNYLYANPVNYGSAASGREGRVHILVDRLANYLHIPRTQTALLSDSAPQPQVPFKAVIENAILDFLDTSRAQDRIILLFVGHAAEIKGQPYLVPLEGELDKPEHLLPLSWVYDQLAKCRARQKVLMLDVCRFDPTHGEELPDGGVMGTNLDAALKAPPDGVQVISLCVAGQYSYEFDNASLSGGLALSQLARLTLRGRPTQTPADSLPLTHVAEAINSLTRFDLASLPKAQQTVRLTGQEKPGEASYPAEPRQPLVIQAPLMLESDVASDDEVRRILAEIDVPPVKRSRTGALRVRAESVPHFSARVLAPYRADEDSPLKRAVLQAIELLRNEKVSQAFPDEFRLPEGGEKNFKELILNLQKSSVGPGVAQLVLAEGLEELQKAGADRDKEPSKRWQANYDYVLARLLARLAYVNEHNYMLGQLRLELPPRDPKLHNGWRLASQQEIQSGKEARDLAREAQALFQKLIKEHPGTPWALLAKRERLTALGLRWEPVRLGQWQ
jgi:hypothetical protein